MIKFVLAALVVAQSVSGDQSLNDRIDTVMQTHGQEQLNRALTDFQIWWYHDHAAPYRHRLNKRDTLAISRLLSRHDTSFVAAAVLIKSPSSLKYVRPQIRMALKREIALRIDYGKLNLPLAPSSGFEVYRSLKCLDNVIKTDSTNGVDCALIDQQENQFLTRQRAQN